MTVRKKWVYVVMFLLPLAAFGPQRAEGSSFVVRTAHQLQRALDDAGSNGEDDLIRVMPGRYVGNFRYRAFTESKNLTIVGGRRTGAGDDATYEPSSILRARNQESVLDMANYRGGRISIKGLTIIGYRSPGADVALKIKSSYDPRDRSGGGGDIALRYNRIAGSKNAAADLQSVTVRRNRAAGNILLVGNTVSNNGSTMRVRSAGYRTGNITCIGNRISGNDSLNLVADITARAYPGNITFRDNMITANGEGSMHLCSSASGEGRKSGDIEILNNIITDNAGIGGTDVYDELVRVLTVSGQGPAGGMTFSGNTLKGNGGGGGNSLLLFAGGRGGGGPVSIEHNTVTGNRGGAKVWVADTNGCSADAAAGFIAVDGNTISGNGDPDAVTNYNRGLIIDNDQSAAWLSITGNAVNGNRDTGIRLYSSCAPAGGISVVGNSVGANLGDGLYLGGALGKLDVQGNDLYDNGNEDSVCSGAKIFGAFEGLVVTGNRVTGNKCIYGMMIDLYGGSPEVEVSDNLISSNGIPAGGDNHGLLVAIREDNPLAKVALAGNDISENLGIGAEFIVRKAAHFEFTGNTVFGNSGGILFGGGEITDTVVFESNRILRNVSLDSGGGGRLSQMGSSPALVFKNNVVTGNTASHDGGGVYLLCPGAGVVEITGNTITENTAGVEPRLTSGGGLLVASGDSSILFTNNVIARNSATRFGGGLYLYNGSASDAEVVFVNNSLTENSLRELEGYRQYGAGAAIDCANIQAYNNVVWGNYIWGKLGPDDFNLLSSADVVNWSGYKNDYGSIAFNGAGGAWTNSGGNFSADPLFVDGARGDYRLSLGSPCIDSGDNDAPNLPDTDIQGGLRILDGDADGTTVVDLGASEFALP